MHYAVVGLGAVGSVVGGFLTRVDEDVLLVGKNYQIDVIKKKGLFNNNISVNENLKMTDDFSLLSDRDVVFLCVKSQDTKKTVEQMKLFLKKSVLIISLQNGVQNAAHAKEVSGLKILSSVVLFNAVYQQEGFILLTIKGGILLENAEGYEKVLLQVCRVFKKAGIDVTLVDDIHALCWSKLVLNLQMAVTALTGQTIEESLKNKVSRKIIIATLQEGIKVVKQSGVRLSKLPGIDPRWMICILKIFGSFSSTMSRWFLGMKKNARNSLLQSLERGKKTEIDYINGEITHLAKQQNLKAPINMKLVDLIKEMESESFKKYFKPDELKKILKID